MSKLLSVEAKGREGILTKSSGIEEKKEKSEMGCSRRPMVFIVGGTSFKSRRCRAVVQDDVNGIHKRFNLKLNVAPFS